MAIKRKTVKSSPRTKPHSTEPHGKGEVVNKPIDKLTELIEIVDGGFVPQFLYVDDEGEFYFVQEKRSIAGEPEGTLEEFGTWASLKDVIDCLKALDKWTPYAPQCNVWQVFETFATRSYYEGVVA